MGARVVVRIPRDRSVGARLEVVRHLAVFQVRPRGDPRVGVGPRGVAVTRVRPGGPHLSGAGSEHRVGVARRLLVAPRGVRAAAPRVRRGGAPGVARGAREVAAGAARVHDVRPGAVEVHVQTDRVAAVARVRAVAVHPADWVRKPRAAQPVPAEGAAPRPRQLVPPDRGRPLGGVHPGLAAQARRGGRGDAAHLVVQDGEKRSRGGARGGGGVLGMGRMRRAPGGIPRRAAVVPASDGGLPSVRAGGPAGPLLVAADAVGEEVDALAERVAAHDVGAVLIRGLIREGKTLERRSVDPARRVSRQLVARLAQDGPVHGTSNLVEGEGVGEGGRRERIEGDACGTARD